MPGRLTAVMRHLTEPAKLAYVYDMEGALYDVDVTTLRVKKLFEKPVPGWHGKGAYAGQGLLVVGNNGGSAAKKFDRPPHLVGADPKSAEEAGVLATLDGNKGEIIARRQFAEVTGPAGIDASYTKPDDPAWAVGWDKRSLLLYVLNRGAWHTFRRGTPPDPCLMTGYDHKRVDLSHDAAADVTFTIELDFLRDGTWKRYGQFKVLAGQTVRHEFPPGCAAHWVRVKADRDCRATAWFVYE